MPYRHGDSDETFKNGLITRWFHFANLRSKSLTECNFGLHRETCSPEANHMVKVLYLSQIRSHPESSSENRSPHGWSQDSRPARVDRLCFAALERDRGGVGVDQPY